MVPPAPPGLELWTRRSRRARQLAGQYPAASQILHFYADLAAWQGDVSQRVRTLDQVPDFTGSLLDLIRRAGPKELSESTTRIDTGAAAALLQEYWDGTVRNAPSDLVCRALLQPYAAALPADRPCPWCSEPPQVGRLQPLGEGLALDLVCPLCLRCRPCPRVRCPQCGESSEKNLPVYSAPEFPQLSLQACDSCRGYLSLVDLSRDPLAIPEVDELAGTPLDLWAQAQGYRKLQPNLAGI